MPSIKHSIVEDLGLIEHEEAQALQKERVRRVLAGGPESILLCEHPPILTLGRLADRSHILTPQSELEARGIRIVETDRGGEVTLHAPGQLVAYPILDLKRRGKDLHRYLRELEQVVIDFLREFDILAFRVQGRTGAWVSPDQEADPQKIASMGIGVSRWVSFHGLAVNVHTDLDLFSLIRPCGLEVAMTSMEKAIGRRIEMAEAKARLTEAFLDE